MRMIDIRAKAKAIGVDPAKMKKGDLVRAIQKAEGVTECFGSGTEDCLYMDCCFRSDCMEGHAQPA